MAPLWASLNTSGTQDCVELCCNETSGQKRKSNAQPFAGKRPSKGFCPALVPEKMRQKASNSASHVEATLIEGA
ncbi:MAG: hypothetical protein Ta2B_07830 [Termitinemataceae bacterium]|nr:MAG: hypothetical protein Ta2B_07830 [Termitinemataceae bacterium]